MLKKHAHVFVALLWLFDLIVISASFAAAFGVRFMLPATSSSSSVRASLTVLGLALPLWSACFYFNGLYSKSRRTEARSQEIVALGRATGLAALLLVTAQYFIGDAIYSRAVILLFTVSSFFALAATRIIARNFLASLRRNGRNVRYALVVGANHLSEALITRLNDHPQFGIVVVGVLSAETDRVGTAFAGSKIVGSYNDLPDIVHRMKADQVYLAMTGNEHAELMIAHAKLATETVDVCIVPDVVSLDGLRRGVEEMDGLPLIHLRTGPALGFDAWAKRAFDLAAASFVLMLAAPVMAVCAVAIKLSSRGPIFYTQERMGLDRRVFGMLKFRSMPVNAESGTGAVWAKAGENRAFAFGAFMRKYSLDEVPQFINVLKGDMSLVGPRPERPVFIEKFKHTMPRYNLRHKMKAGITGLAQVEGWRGNTDLEKRLERDLHYIENWSLWLDVKIFVRTGLGGFLSKNAY